MEKEVLVRILSAYRESLENAHPDDRFGLCSASYRSTRSANEHVEFLDFMRRATALRPFVYNHNGRRIWFRKKTSGTYIWSPFDRKKRIKWLERRIRRT